MFATNYINPLMKAFIHLYLAFYVIFISLKTLYLSITFILIYILEARCTHTGDNNNNNRLILRQYPRRSSSVAQQNQGIKQTRVINGWMKMLGCKNPIVHILYCIFYPIFYNYFNHLLICIS